MASHRGSNAPISAGAAPAWSKARALGYVVGFVLIAAWAVWLIASLRAGRWVVDPPRIWFFRWEMIGVDFLNCYAGSRHWMAGGNPYREPIGDPVGRPYVYPPRRCRRSPGAALVGPTAAVRIWTAVIVALLSLGTYACWRTRRALGLSEIPFPLAWALVFLSTPLLYAVERGNTDCLNLMLIVGLAWLLRVQTPARDALAGACVAIGAMYKVYPGFLVLGLVALRRWVSVLSCALTFAAIATLSLDQMIASIDQLRALSSREAPSLVDPSVHSLSGTWKHLWQGRRLVHRFGASRGRSSGSGRSSRWRSG